MDEQIEKKDWLKNKHKEVEHIHTERERERKERKKISLMKYNHINAVYIFASNLIKKKLKIIIHAVFLFDFKLFMN